MNQRKKTPEINFDTWLTGVPEAPPAAAPAPRPKRTRTAPRRAPESAESAESVEVAASVPIAPPPAVADAADGDVRAPVRKEESKKTDKTESKETGILTDLPSELDAAAADAVRANSGLYESKNSDPLMTRIVALVVAQEQGGGNDKVKASFHVNRSTVTTLDAIQFSLKNLTGLNGHDVSKSKILDIIMALMAVEIADAGGQSRLAQILSQTAAGAAGGAGGAGGSSDE